MNLQRTPLLMLEWHPKRLGSTRRVRLPKQQDPSPQLAVSPKAAPTPKPRRVAKKFGSDPRDHPPWDKKGELSLSDKEHGHHINMLNHDVGDAHPTRHGSKVTAADHAHATDSLLRHHQRAVTNATHGHYQKYRGGSLLCMGVEP